MGRVSKMVGIRRWRECENGMLIEGVLKFGSYGRLIGKFSNGMLNDENGRVVLSAGVEYEGSVVNNECYPFGKITFSALGIVYEGEFGEGSIMNGTGKFTFANGDVFSGKVIQSVVDGEGELVRLNGDVYTGVFKQNKTLGTLLSVQGKLVRADGSEVEGAFELDVSGGGGSGGGSHGTENDGSSGDSSNSGTKLSMVGLNSLWSFIHFSLALPQNSIDTLSRLQDYQRLIESRINSHYPWISSSKTFNQIRPISAQK